MLQLSDDVLFTYYGVKIDSFLGVRFIRVFEDFLFHFSEMPINDSKQPIIAECIVSYF